MAITFRRAEACTLKLNRNKYTFKMLTLLHGIEDNIKKVPNRNQKQSLSNPSFILI